MGSFILLFFPLKNIIISFISFGCILWVLYIEEKLTSLFILFMILNSTSAAVFFCYRCRISS